jgi:hypothetical protein
MFLFDQVQSIFTQRLFDYQKMVEEAIDDMKNYHLQRAEGTLL